MAARSVTDAAAGRERALAAARAGDRAAAGRLFAQVCARCPHDASLLNSAGSFHAGAGSPDEALRYFDRALGVDPFHAEATINRAVVLTRLNRSREAAALLRAGETRLSTQPRYWTARGAAEIDAGDKAAAAASYDRALLREPRHPRALAGRARMALERGEPSATAWHERALAITPGDPHLLLGWADALESAGRRAEALAITEALAHQAPGWLAGMERHAALRWSSGEADGFCDHYAAANAGVHDAAFYRSWAALLAGVDRPAEAADVAAAGRRHHPDDRALALAEASYRDAAGDTRAAAAIFAHGRGADAEWQTHEARHRLRLGDPAAADALLHLAVASAPDHVAAWSLRDLAWRLLDDPRHVWLSRQPGFIEQMELGLSDADMEQATATLDSLHDRAAMPIGQSVKRGSQTKGSLFDRTEPIVARIGDAVRDAVERYRRALPAADPTHPLLRHRDAEWGITGSWSIRLAGEGHHAAHIHPLGIVSSAAYVVLPDTVGAPDQPGWLEIGCPPDDLKLDLAPIATIRPRVGWCVLFPSTLYHGTRPIAGGKRMTVAFDVTAAS